MESTHVSTHAQWLFMACFGSVVLLALLAVSLNPGTELWVQGLLLKVAEHFAPAIKPVIESR